jgi:hypothetical protein
VPAAVGILRVHFWSSERTLVNTTVYGKTDAGSRRLRDTRDPRLLESAGLFLHSNMAQMYPIVRATKF